MFTDTRRIARKPSRRQLAAAAPAPRAASLYRTQEAESLRILGEWVTDTHRRLYRDVRTLHAYHVPSTATAYGQLIAVPDGEDPPAGAALICAEPISGFLTRDQLYARYKRLTDRLAMYPHHGAKWGGA